jgi:outer membrane receptor protein involved in Fe transport
MVFGTFLSYARKLLFSLVVVSLPLAAQTGLGIVRGTVQDVSKAVIPSAKVSLTSASTGVVRNAESSSVGIYYFGAVPIGPYTLAIEAQGFKKWTGTLEVFAGQTVAIDPTMEVGSLEATVEVTGATPVISTEGGQVSDVKDALRIHQLPLDGRSITTLFNLTPGVEGGGNPRVNGMKVGSTEMLLDGISLVDRFGGGMSRVQPGLDTIQEFRIETTGSGAQYSRPATVSLVTKSGTNEIHGAAFETFRNNFGGLRARQRQDLPNPGEPFKQAQYIRNEYGVSMGGPVIKNKTFWFFAYEAARLRQGDFERTQAPTEAMWAGDFSNAITTNSEAITIYDPFSTKADGSRTPFPNNKIPSNLISPFAQTMHSISPQPTTSGNPWIEPNFQTYYPDQNDTDTMTIKGDHVFSPKDNISGRFTKSERTSKVFGGVFGFPKPGCNNCGGSSLQHPLVYSTIARWNHVFSPTFLNEFQASNHRSPKDSGTLGNNVAWADKLGLPNPFGVTGWPTISISEPFLYYGWDGDNRKGENLTAFQLDDNVTWIKGKHSFKFGFKGRQEYNNIRELQQSQGSHSFYGDWTALYDAANDDYTPFTGSGLASLELGLPTYLSNQYNRGYYYFRQKEIGAYAQDSWKLSPRVTLDLGLRWDKWTPYKEKYDRLVNVDLKSFADQFQVITPHNTTMESMQGIPPAVLESWKLRGLSWVTADSIHFPGSLLPADNNNFGPRLGLAVRLTDKWVVRGGYGRYFWTMPLSQILQTSRTNPPLNLRFQNELDNLNGNEDFHALKHVPAADEFIGKATVDTTTIQGISSRAQSIMAWDARDWQDDHADEWNFTIERELMKETALRLSYIGNHGSSLEQRFNINAVESELNYETRTGKARPSNPDLRRINRNWNFAAANHTGYSNTHSLQANIERRYSNGLAFQWFYTFTHSLTTTDAGGFTSGNGDINARGTGAFGVPENGQIIGEPSMSYNQRLRLGYFNSGNIPSHRIRWNGIYDLPFGKGKRFGANVSSALNHVVGGWQIAFIGVWGSGNWLSPSSSRYLFGDPTLNADQRLEMNIFGLHQRLWFRGDFDPTKATGVDLTKLEQLVPVDRSQRVLRPVGADFTNRVPVRLANGSVRLTSITDNVNWSARNFFRGPGSWNQDISLFKTFQITERIKTRFTADFFNALNHANDVNPSSTSGLQDLSVQGNEPRIIQLSLRVEW